MVCEVDVQLATYNGGLCTVANAPLTANPPAMSEQNAAPADTPYPKRIKSYVLRAGRTTTGQSKALDQLGPVFTLPYQPTVLDAPAVFGRVAPLILEIGFGMGESTAYIAGVRPEDNFLCCEVHVPGVGALLKRIGEQNLSNIRIVAHDAVEVLDHMLGADALDGAHIFFPDPWHKKRHNKRRLIQAAFVEKLVGRLRPGGYLHCATDWENYAEQILEVLQANPHLENTATLATGYANKPDYRPLTKFENRGIKLGHGVWDLVFRKR